MIDGAEWLLPQRCGFSCDLENALDLAHSTTFAHTIEPFADRLRDCGGHAFTRGLRQFAGKPMRLFVLDVYAHMVPFYHHCLLFYHSASRPVLSRETLAVGQLTDPLPKRSRKCVHAVSVKVYSCWPSRMISTRLPARSPTTNSNPSVPGSIVMNDVVPSSFFRDATVLFHSPRSKVVTPLSVSTARSPSSLLE